MMSKLEQVFKDSTVDSYGFINDKQQLDYLLSKLTERQLIIPQDKELLLFHIKDFPFSFNNFINYIQQIYKLDIENLIKFKTNQHEDILNHINKYLSFIDVSTLSNVELVQILNSLSKNENYLNNSIKNIRKAEFIIKNIRDDIQKFLWEKIYQTREMKGDDFFKKLEVDINDPYEYQQKYQEKINFEFEIIRVKKFHEKGNAVFKAKDNLKEITSDEVYCLDRNILIKCYKIPNCYYNKNELEHFYFKCEASKELLLSKYFPHFLGYDDSSNDEFQYYFYENISDGIKIIEFFRNIETENPETSFFFKYLAKEILCAFKDLLNKCTYSFEFPITCDNIYYDKKNYRLYLPNIIFGPRRKSIMESHEILESKLLYFYGMILLNLLSIKYPRLNELINILNERCSYLEEFGKMQKVFDYIDEIEDTLTKNLKNDVIICIIIECLITPYKAKIVFDEFYEKKNFLNKAIKARYESELSKGIIHSGEEGSSDDNRMKQNIKKKTDIPNVENNQDRDKCAIMSPYYEKNEDKEIANENVIKKSLSINMLLIHPFYSKTNLDENFLRFLFKENEENKK